MYMPGLSSGIYLLKTGVNKMKKKFIAGAVVAICLSLVTYGTLAYFTHEDTATNVITSGNIKIELQETAITEDGQVVEFEQSQDRFNVMPAQSVSKIVKVQNTGDNDAYIRIAIDKTINLAEGVEGTPDTDLISMDFDYDNWTLKDGYYYYNKPLAPGETTEALFNNVKFDPAMDNMYQNSTAIINVDAQATQVRNNGTDVFTAAGWPEALK